MSMWQCHGYIGLATMFAFMVWVLTAAEGVGAQLVGNLTAAEIAFAGTLGMAYTTADVTTLSGLGTANGKWQGAAIAPITGKLYAAPFSATSVLVIDPATNMMDVSILGGLGAQGAKWWGIAFAPPTNKLYAAPFGAESVLVVDPANNTTDTSTLGGLGSVSGKWAGIAFASTTNKLYAAPNNAVAVLVVDPVTNTSDVTSMANLGQQTGKWRGIAFLAITNKLYTGSVNLHVMLVIDPATNATATIAGPIAGFYSVAFASVTNKLYATPGTSAPALFVVDPVSNATDASTLRTGSPGSTAYEWIGLAYSPVTKKLYAAPAYNEALLIVDPLTNTTDTHTLSGFRDVWSDIVFSPDTNKLYAVPGSASAVIIVDFSADAGVLIPFRMIAQQQTMITELLATTSYQQRTIDGLNSSLIVLQSEQSSVCSRPLCANGTVPSNGMCVPDCEGLRRRSITCEPFCTAPPTVSPTVSPTMSPTASPTASPTLVPPSASSTFSPTLRPNSTVAPPIHTSQSGSPTASPTTMPSALQITILSPTDENTNQSSGNSLMGVAVGIAIIVVVLGLGVFISTRQRRRRQQFLPQPPQTATISMYVNPLHSDFPAAASSPDYEEPVSLHHTDGPRVSVDSELYVAGPDNPSTLDAQYSLFRSEGLAQRSEATA